MTQILATLPVVSWHRIYQLGTVLNTLCACALKVNMTHQAVTDVHRDFDDTELMSKKIESVLSHQTEIHPMEHDMFLRIKNIIQSGDIQALPMLEKSVNFGDLPFRRFGNVDFLRVVKDYFIFFCATEFYCAVEAGMPYATCSSCLLIMVIDIISF